MTTQPAYEDAAPNPLRDEASPQLQVTALPVVDRGASDE